MEYLDSATETSLQHLCAVIVVGEILVNREGIGMLGRINEDYGRLPSMVARGISKWEDEIKRDAANDLRTLRLPPVILDILQDYVEPLIEEIKVWISATDALHPPRIKLAFTWRGSFDIAQMAKMVVEDESQGHFVRYILACNYCLEDYIPKLAKLLDYSDHEKLEDESNGTVYMFAEMWADGLPILARAKDGKTLLERLDRDLLYDTITEVMKKCYSVSLNYLRKIPARDASRLIAKRWWNYDGRRFEISPFDFRWLYAQLSEERKKKHIDCFMTDVLMMYLKWPYQGTFLDVYPAFANNLCFRQFIFMSSIILDLVTSKKKDYDYEQLLFGFWKLSSDKLNELKDLPCPNGTGRPKRTVATVREILARRKDFCYVESIFINVSTASWMM